MLCRPACCSVVGMLSGTALFLHVPTPVPVSYTHLRDLIAVAQTGKGKPAAYLLPILNKLSEGGHPADAINCIVMAPTRELAQQIDQQLSLIHI